MIVLQQKDLTQILALIVPYQKILVVGCNGCATVCLAGGANETSLLAGTLRIAAIEQGRSLEVTDHTVLRQCEPEFLIDLVVKVGQAEAILALGCGAGIQTMAESWPNKHFLPAVDTMFIGSPMQTEGWQETCSACGNCTLDQTFAICVETRCAKGLRNGPCGGARDGMCEANPQIECVWLQVYAKARSMGQLDKLRRIIPIKDWSDSRHGGPRRLLREEKEIAESPE